MSSPDTEASVVDMLTESLLPGRPDALRRVFNAHGARAPFIIWSPQPQELQSPQIRRFAEICTGFADDQGRVAKSAFKLAAFGQLTDWIMLVEPEDSHYRYVHYGAGIAEFYGRNMTGGTTEGFTSHIAQFFEALYRAAQQRGEWVLSEHEPPAAVFVRSWRRLIVPLMGEDGKSVEGFAVANLPENDLRAGLELMVDPVFVLDAEQQVHFANRAAHKMFGIDTHGTQGATLQGLTGITLDTGQSPEELLSAQAREDSIELTLNGGIAERLVMTLSAAEHRGTAYYIAVMRLLGT
ncbi:MAG: PAS domain-containing protein [Pseudomonadota bacterium]